MKLRKTIAVMLAGALVLTTLATGATSEAAKSTKLKTKKVSIFVKGKKKISITGKKAKHTYTFTSKKAKIAKVSKSGVITGVKAGKTTIVVKDTWKQSGKKKTKKLGNVAVTVKNKSVDPVVTAEPTQAVTAAPSQTPGGTQTTAPSQNPGGTQTQTPGGTQTTAPSQTPGGTQTTAPSQTPGGSQTAGPSQTPGGSQTAAPSQTPGGTQTAGPSQTPGGSQTAGPSQTPGGSQTAGPSQTPGGTQTAGPSQTPGGTQAPDTTATAPAPTAVPDLPVPLSQTEFGPTLGHYQVVGYADIDPEKLEAGDKIVVTYAAECDAAVKFQGEVKDTSKDTKQELGNWGTQDAALYEASYNLPTQGTYTVTFKTVPEVQNGMRVSLATNTDNNSIQSFEIESVKVVRGEEEVEDAVTATSSKYEFAGVNNYGELAKVSLKGLYDPSKYEGVSITYSVSGDADLSTQVKVLGSKNCKTPISDKSWDVKVAAIEYSGSTETSVTRELSFAGLADDDLEPSVAIVINRDDKAKGFAGKVTIKEIKLIAKK